ncbi:MAG: linear amide C-N hydrolase [Bacteroidales bacterium]
MKISKLMIAVMFLGSGFISLQGHSCTTFCLADDQGNIVFGRNFDFPAGQGHIHINKRNLLKVSLISPPEKPFSWTSSYGSITFNQNGKEFPYGGMNEAGLVIEQMWHQDARYPVLDERYGLTELQWIQYQLDQASTVQDVIESDKLVRVSFTSVATLHFLVSDALGNVATIEYIDGKMIVHTGNELKYPVLSNCTYQLSLDYASKKAAGIDSIFSPWTENSSGRFTIAAKAIEKYRKEGGNAVTNAFSILDLVSQGPATQWSIVYHPSAGQIWYKSNQNPTLKKLDFFTFDFSCESDEIFADIHDNLTSKKDFEPFSFEANFNMIDSVCNSVEFLSTIPEEYRMMAARYSGTAVCPEEEQLP